MTNESLLTVDRVEVTRAMTNMPGNEHGTLRVVYMDNL